MTYTAVSVASSKLVSLMFLFTLQSWPTRALLVPCESITQSDYMTASQQRTRMMDQLKQIFRGYAAVVTPSTGIPPVRIHEGDLATGPLDAEETIKILK